MIKLRRRIVAPGRDTWLWKNITSAQLLALNATPQIIVPACAATSVHIFKGMWIYKPAGTAYGGIAAGEDLSVKYTDVNGLAVGNCETTGFLDQATAQARYVSPYNAASGASEKAVVPGAPLVLHLLVGEITTGVTGIRLKVYYKTVAIQA